MRRALSWILAYSPVVGRYMLWVSDVSTMPDGVTVVADRSGWAAGPLTAHDTSVAARVSR